MIVGGGYQDDFMGLRAGQKKSPAGADQKATRGNMMPEAKDANQMILGSQR